MITLIPSDFNLWCEILIKFCESPGKIVPELEISDIFKLSQEKFPLLQELKIHYFLNQLHLQFFV